MSRYYFHVRSGSLFYKDPEGFDYDSIEVALEEAIDAAREMTADAVRKGDLLVMRTFEITDVCGHIVAKVPFSDAVRLK